MSDFWSSALNRFGVGSDASSGSRFVGQTVVLEEGNKLHVKKVIAKGKKLSVIFLGKHSFIKCPRKSFK